MLRSVLLSAAFFCLFTATAYAGGFYVCNEAGEVISVAYGRFENNKWGSSGWTNVAVNRCYGFTNTLTSTRYYLLVKGASGKIWGGNHPFCADTGGFYYPDGTNRSTCKTTMNFFSVWVLYIVTGQFPDHYAAVIGPNNQNLNHPRAER